MPRAARTCSTCHRITHTQGRCDHCARLADKLRRTDQVSYGATEHRRFRSEVLRRDPICKLCGAAWATVADHHPVSRRELQALGKDPNDPTCGRGLCKPCHDRETARNQPGGWNARTRPQSRNTNTILVAGPPCAGKSTYIDTHMQPGDVVIDFDHIMSRLTGRPLHDHDEQRVHEVWDIRDGAIRDLLASAQSGWIVASAPRRIDRYTYGLPVVLVLPTINEALDRVSRERPTRWKALVRHWFEKYEPDSRDLIITATGMSE